MSRWYRDRPPPFQTKLIIPEGYEVVTFEEAYGEFMTDSDYSPHETWCDTQNNISERCNCIVSEYIEKIEALESRCAKLLAALEDYARRRICMENGKATMQVRNGHDEWINTVPFFKGETILIGEDARRAIEEYGK